MQQVFDTVLEALLREGNVSPQTSGAAVRVLLAVSGGIDSMCMAELFRNTAVKVDFAVAHCNFSLRGDESDSDEELVSAWTQRYGVMLHKVRFDTSGYASGKGMSIEMAARELRYGWFAGLCRRFGYSAVAVAHNANDNAETLFLNLLRGTGIKGLSGMRAVSALPVHCPDAVLIRPLLSFTRKQIEGYVFAHKTEYHNDSTNAGTEYKRNKIRNLVFPVFSQINPSFIRTVNRDMVYISQAAGIADSYYARNSDWLSAEKISLSRLLADPHWEYLLYRVMDGYGFSPSVTASLTDLLKSDRTVGGKVFESQEYELVTSSSELTVRKVSVPADESPGHSSSLRLRRYGTLPGSVVEAFGDRASTLTVQGPGNYSFGGVRFSVEVLSRSEVKSLKTPSGVLLFDLEKMDFPFICRKWENGDWFIPLGMKGKKKVSDLFTDLKYSIVDKSEAVILLDGHAAGGADRSHIAAVLGVRIDDSKRISDRTVKVLVIKSSNID